MHELSVAMSLIAEAQAVLDSEPTGRVTVIEVRVGDLSGVVPEALQTAFESARAGTPFTDTVLRIEAVPVTIHCPTCAADRPVASIQSLRCATCDTPGPLATGKELELYAMEIDDAPPTTLPPPTSPAL